MAGRLGDTGALGFLAVVLALFALLAAAPVIGARAAGAGAQPEQPLAVTTSSLTQQGQDLVWQLSLAEPFSPADFPRENRSLCLLIERPGGGSSHGSKLCLSGPGPGARTPRLLYVPPAGSGPGSGNAIAATITRSSDRELTATFPPARIGFGYRPLR